MSSETPSQLIHALSQRVCQQMSKTVFGREDSARMLVGAFLIGGHVLLEGPPGIAKTLLAHCFADSLGLSFKRIQFTPDLMPSDVTGVNMYDQNSASFRFCPGPLFSDIVLADEINRTPPKTQSALLEAMQEKQVTIDGECKALSEFFFVIATQNPIEHEGTFPLPEAQLDRFLFRLILDYTSPEHEQQMIESLSAAPALKAGAETPSTPVVSSEELCETRDKLRAINLSSAISQYILSIAQETRSHADVSLGASPRAALNLALAAKLAAALEGRDYVIPDDVKQMSIPTLNHRLVLNPDLFDSETNTQKVLNEILDRLPVPSAL